MSRALALCVFCSASPGIDPCHHELAAQVGTAVAQRGWVLVSGGGAMSSMGALARAARAAGGRTVGVIPQALVELEVADHDADELVVTTGMRQRKAEMERRADAFLALPGGLGTLEELFEVWVAASLGLHAKPVVVLDPDGVLAPMRAQVDALVTAGFVRPQARALLRWAGSLGEALDLAAAASPRPATTDDELLEAEPTP